MIQLYKTYQPSVEDIKRDWYLVDAKDKVLGRMATRVATLLIGKHKRVYVPHLDLGDFVVVVNATGVVVSGKKAQQKTYFRHSGYPGGLKAVTFRQLKEKDPTRIIEKAVYNMIPKNRLRSQRMNRLRVFVGEENPYKDKFQITNSKLQT